jgi:hypothetical protein
MLNPKLQAWRAFSSQKNYASDKFCEKNLMEASSYPVSIIFEHRNNAVKP